MATSKRGPASVPAQPSDAWAAWEDACAARLKHLRECTDCPVDGYCEEGRRLNIAEVTTHRAVTHPGETP